jgi:hypothetical protein
VVEHTQEIQTEAKEIYLTIIPAVLDFTSQQQPAASPDSVR